MFDLNTFMTLATLIAGWVATTQGSNALFAAICAAALCGFSARVCVGLTLLLHLVLMLL